MSSYNTTTRNEEDNEASTDQEGEDFTTEPAVSSNDGGETITDTRVSTV